MSICCNDGGRRATLRVEVKKSISRGGGEEAGERGMPVLVGGQTVYSNDRRTVFYAEVMLREFHEEPKKSC